MRKQNVGPGSTAVLNGTRRDAVVEPSRPSKTSQATVKLLPFHPLADMFPLIEGDDFAGLVEDIRKNGQREDIDIFDGKIIDGRNRGRACVEAGVEPRYHERRFKAEAGLVDFIISKNIHRRHLTIAQKRELLAKLIKQTPEKSDTQIGKMAKVSKNTAASVRRDLERRGQIDHVETRVDTKGREQPAEKKHRPIDKQIACDKRIATEPEPLNELDLLREFARFVIDRSTVKTDPKDHSEWKGLLDRVKAMLPGRSS